MFFGLFLIAIALAVAGDENKWIRVNDHCLRPYGFRRPILCFEETELVDIGDEIVALFPRAPPSMTTTTTTSQPITTLSTASVTTTTSGMMDKMSTTKQDEKSGGLVFYSCFL